MTKPKTLEQLRAEKERAEIQLAQEQHKLERLENRKKYLEKGERTKRTHRLCNLGGTIESLAPEFKDDGCAFVSRLSPDTSFCSPDAPACAVPVQAASQLVPFRLGAGRGFSVLSLGLTSFFDFGDKKRPSTFRIVRPVNGQFFGIQLLCSVR